MQTTKTPLTHRQRLARALAWCVVDGIEWRGRQPIVRLHIRRWHPLTLLWMLRGFIQRGYGPPVRERR